MKKKVSLLVLLITSICMVGCSGGGGSVGGSASSASDKSLNSMDEYTSDGLASYAYNGEYYDDSYVEESYDSYEDESYEDKSYEEEESYEDDSYEEESTQTTEESNNIVLVEDKLVYKCYVNIETLDFEKSYSLLQAMMTKYDCIISSETFGDESISYFYNDYSSSSQYKTGKVDEIVIRVPSYNYKDFISDYTELGNVTSKTQTVDNITQEYYDTTSQVAGLKEEMKRLELMMKQAVEIEDMITINQSITELQHEINTLTTHIRTMDSDVAYSYVTLTLKEVVEYSEEEAPIKTNTFMDRLKNQCVDTWEGFINFLEDLLFAIISLIPAIVIIGIIIIIIKITCKDKIKTWKENRKLRKVSSDNSMDELSTLLKYDENKVISKVDTDESKNKQ